MASNKKLKRRKEAKLLYSDLCSFCLRIPRILGRHRTRRSDFSSSVSVANTGYLAIH